MPFDGSETLDPVAKTLLDAVNIIQRDGWCQGAFRRNDGRRCAVGAIRATGSNVQDQALRRLSKVVSGVNVFSGMQIAAWNDCKGRTAEQVIDALERAAAAR